MTNRNAYEIMNRVATILWNRYLNLCHMEMNEKRDAVIDAYYIVAELRDYLESHSMGATFDSAVSLQMD